MKAIKEFFFFGLAGVLGFSIDAGVLYLVKPVVDIYFGRMLSFFLAVIVTWLFNRNITFKERNVQVGILTEFMQYFSLMIVGGCLNLGAYYILISSYELFQQWPILAVAVGSLVGMAANFLTSRFLLYRK